MKAWIQPAFGAPLRIETLPDPEPGPGEVRVRVAAAGVNFADLLMSEGRYQDRVEPPFVPGLELSGTVEALGPGVAGPGPGTRIAAHVRCGAFAERVCVPADRLVALPEGMPFPVAAGFLIAYGTSHLALTHLARLRPGETLFVTGAAGGVGLTAVEIGRILGARVIAQVRGPDKAEIARKTGAEAVIDGAVPDLKSALRALGGIDVTYDTVGGAGFDAAMRATRPGGRMLAIGFAGGEVPQVPLNQLLVRNISVHGMWWGGYLSFAPGVLMESLAALIDSWRGGRLRPHVSAELPFDCLPEALEAIRSRKATGKVVLTLG